MEGLDAAFARLHQAIDEIFKVLRDKDLRREDRGGTDGDVNRAAERPAHLRIDVSAPTLAVLLEEYEASRRTTDISDVHLANHMTGVRECVKDCGWVFPSQVTAPAIVGHLERRKALGNGPRRRNHVRAYVLHFADWLAARGLIEKINPKAIPRARVPRKRARYCPTRDEVVRLILASSQDWRKGDRWLVYLVAATTGLRTSTLRKLTPAMFKRGDGVAWLEIPGSALKSGVAARVWLTREVANWLELSGNSGRLLRCVPKGDNFDRDLRAAGLDKRPAGEEGSFSPHSLRHFAATYLASADAFTLADRQAQMTHATPAMTEAVYTDHNSRALGEKIFRLQPLIPQGFTPPRGKRSSKTEVKVLERRQEIADTTGATFGSFPDDEPPDSTSSRSDPDWGRTSLSDRIRNAGRLDRESKQRGPPGTSEGTGAIGSNPITPIDGQFDPDLNEVIEAQGRQIHALNSLVRRLREELGRERQHRTTE